MEPKFVIVDWKDAWTQSYDEATLSNVADEHRPMPMQSVGWLLHEDEAGVSIFNERCMERKEPEYRGRTFIPRGMIQTITEYKLVKPRKPKLLKP